MKFVLSKLMAAAAVTLCLAAPAMAQYYTHAPLRTPARPTASAGAEVFASDLQAGTDDDAAVSPSDAAAKPVPGPAAAGPHTPGPCESCLSSDGCGSCCDCCDDSLCCPKTEPWRIFENCCTKRHSLVIEGWINGGATYNADNPATRFNGPVTFNDRDEEGQLNQFYIFAQKTVNTDDCCLDVGGRVDLLYGTDSRFTKSLGLELHQDGNDRWNSERFYQLSMPQVYAELGYNDWSVKVGHFYTILGYEVITAPDNFFYSHSYEFQYAEPFTHTGILATKKMNDQFSFSLGIHNGWNQWEDANDKLSFLGGVNFANCDQSRKLALSITSGDEFAVTGVDDNRTTASLVYTRALTERLTYVFQSDIGWQDSGVRVGNQLDRAEWYGVNQYLLYQLNCNWWGGMRFEWFRDDDGTRVSSIDSGSFPSGNPAIGGYEGDFTQFTLGLNYKPSANLIVRPEVRWDHYNGRPGPNGLPYDDGSKDDQFLMAIDAILKF